MEFLCKRVGNTLTVEFRDDGIRFDPTAWEPKPDDDRMSMEEGGFGIRFYREIAAKTEWAYTGGKNVLTLCFRL